MALKKVCNFGWTANVSKRNLLFVDDIRYSELQFLRGLQNGSIDLLQPDHLDQIKMVGLDRTTYIEMAATLLEDLYIRFDDDHQLLVARLRGELSESHTTRQYYGWHNPREGIRDALSGQNLRRLRITYRGLRRIEELRDLLRQDRILERFGILLDLRYFQSDLEDALQGDSSTSVSVIYADMDNFKQINTNYGHSAGDIVMKNYLTVVQRCLGNFGKAYRAVGDETVSLIIGQNHKRAAEIAEMIRTGVESMQCEHDGKKLPKVTSSIGVATTPPAKRTADIETLADSRQQKAKESGKNQVIAD